jgi:site-specific DNA-methyltransferase (adenine-specific)
MSLEYRIGDVFDRLAEIPAGSIDLIVTSPPFLALRSYLPDDHPDKHKEIGSEATPADFIDTLLELSSEWGRVLAPHGSMCVELGDTFSGASQGGGDLIPGSGSIQSPAKLSAVNGHTNTTKRKGNGWPLAKSLTGIPTLYPWSLAYGRNLLTGQESPAGQWRIRNVIVWARPNPPVGALGDKFRPATSYITVACKSAKRYFDLDAVRMPHRPNGGAGGGGTSSLDGGVRMGSRFSERIENPAGAPPLDWHADNHPEDGDWLWKLSTQPYKGSHYATFPMALPKRLIEAMCPLRVCETCGAPSTRIVGESTYIDKNGKPVTPHVWASGMADGRGAHAGKTDGATTRQATTLGWTDCGHDAWRPGVVLDPFGGSGTTAEAAQAVGRSAILIDLDARNADLARERVGMFLDVTDTPEQTLT